MEAEALGSSSQSRDMGMALEGEDLSRELSGCPSHSQPSSPEMRPFYQTLTLPRTSVTDAVSSFSAFKLSPTTRCKSESCDHEVGEHCPMIQMCPPCTISSPSLPSTQPSMPRQSPCKPYHWCRTGLEGWVDGMVEGSQAVDLGLYAAIVLCQWDQATEAAPGAAPGLGNTAELS